MATKTFKIGLSATDKQNMAQDIYEQVEELLFEEYDSTKTYNENDYVVYSGVLYRALVDNITGTWDSTKWTSSTLNDLVDEVNSAVASVDDKANVNGNYPTMTVGLADNLTPYGEDSGAEQDNPFISNGTGTNNNTEIVTVGDYGLLKEKQGNTLVVNQLVNTGDTEVETISGHKYWCYINSVYSVITSTGSAIALNDSSVDKVVDLTQWGFSADELTDITTNPSHFSWYYNGDLSYNTGELVNASGVKLVSTGRNLFAGNSVDSPQYIGHYYIDNDNGYVLVANNSYNCYRLRVIPNRTYFLGRSDGSNLGNIAIKRFLDNDENLISGDITGYSYKYRTFTTPSNCVYLEFSVPTSIGDIIDLELYYTPEQGGEGYLDGNDIPIHYDYEEPNVIDTGSEVLRSAGSVKDYKEPNGTIHRLVGTRAYQSGDENDSSLLTDGTTTYYPLETETTEQGIAFSENLPINDYGMLYWLDENDELVGVPQGAKIMFPVNYKGFTDDMYSRVEGDSSKYVIDTQLSASEIARDSVDTQLFNAIGGTLRQCLCVKESLDFNNTGVVDLGDYAWNYDSTHNYFWTDRLVSIIKKPSNDQTKANMICSLYETDTFLNIYNQTENMTIGIHHSSGVVNVRNTTYTDATTFKNAMKGVLLAYEKA